MHIIDWIFFSLPLFIVVAVAFYTNRYTKSVAHYMSGGRLAGRYLIAVARGEMQAGAVAFVAAFEMYSQSGFVLGWYYKVFMPITLIIAISGFVIYRYRETRVMTLAQFFEVRYSKSFRIFGGCLGFLAGILNFGIIPAVGSRFMVYFLKLPPSFELGWWSIPTYIPLMGLFLLVTVAITLSGGILTIMTVDCVEGIISQLFYLVIIIGLLFMFDWSQISHILADRPPGQSFLNPFDAGELKDFNLTYTLMGVWLVNYATMAWQNASAYNSAALNAHESRMSGLLGRWREMGKGGVVGLLAICAMTFLAHPDFASQSAHANELISQIPEPQIQKQMKIPIAVSEMLPIGINGMLCAILFMGIIGGDSTHLHSWGGIFIQDIIVPLRKKPLSPKEHMAFLRWGVFGVALFAFLFGCLFKQTEYINMWWQVTTGVFVGGAGAVIIGGLYWKKGTVSGAWASMIAGAVLSLGGIVCRQIYGDSFFLNGTKIYFVVTLICILVYVAVSLLTCKEEFNMERMLHRGSYAPAESTGSLPVLKLKPSWKKWIGIDENFTRGDQLIAGGLLVWTLFWSAIVIVGSLWYWISPFSITVWSTYWHLFGVGVPIFFAVSTGIWFTWGGVKDLRRFFTRLKQTKVNELDNGMVVNRQNLDETRAP